MRKISTARIFTILAITLLVGAGCDGAPPEQPDAGATQPGDGAPMRDLRLGLGYSADSTGGGTSFIISIDVLAEPNTNYETRVSEAGSAVGTSEITTNDRGVGAGTQQVDAAGTYTVEVFDQGGELLASEVIEVE